MAALSSTFDAQAFLKELKTNRRTQVALLAFAAVLVWMVWSLAFDTAERRPRRAAASGGAAIDPKALSNLERLPHLSALNQAGELPPVPKLLRDPFLFDAPAPPPPPVKPVKVKPPTESELKAQAEAQKAKEAQALKDQEFNTRPQDLRYIGFLEGTPAGQIGAFIKGEEAMPLVLGTLLRDRWKLVALSEKSATFQNTKYADMKFELTAREAGAAAGATNEY
jgi:hypothetical protein